LPILSFQDQIKKMKGFTTLLSLLCLVASATAFSILPSAKNVVLSSSPSASAWGKTTSSRLERTTKLYMSDQQRQRTTKKGVQTITIDKTETQVEEQKKKEEMWRVVLHNDEVHTFNYVIRSLCKVIGTLDRKAAFEICVQTHGIGKATVTKTWKKQAEQHCLGLQRQGLTVSISPDKDFQGGHAGGGL
jgi:ATP-dependent Clp protease adapter protein ClpS